MEVDLIAVRELGEGVDGGAGADVAVVAEGVGRTGLERPFADDDKLPEGGHGGDDDSDVLFEAVGLNWRWWED